MEVFGYVSDEVIEKELEPEILAIENAPGPLQDPVVSIYQRQIQSSQRAFDGSFFSPIVEVLPSELKVSSAVATIAIPGTLAIEAGLTSAMHIASGANPEVTRLAAIAVATGANTVSIILEARTLRKTKTAASPGGVLLNMVTGKPLASSAIDHAVNYAALLANPVNLVALINNDYQLFADSLIAASLTIPSVNIPLNFSILKGKFEAIVNRGRPQTKTLNEDSPQPISITDLDLHRHQRAMRER